MPRPRFSRRGRCPRSRASGFGSSRTTPPALRSCARAATTDDPPAGRRASRAAPGTSRSLKRRAKLVQERVRLELPPERRDRAVARVHLRLGSEPLEQVLHRLEERLPVASRQVDAPHRLLEEEIAREEPAVDEVRDVTA